MDAKPGRSAVRRKQYCFQFECTVHFVPPSLKYLWSDEDRPPSLAGIACLLKDFLKLGDAKADLGLREEPQIFGFTSVLRGPANSPHMNEAFPLGTSRHG